jgi:hypothetical protein
MEVNMKLMGKFAFIRALVLLAGVVGLSSGLAAAQSGSFTLPVEARWGKAVLPAGEYTYSLDPTYQRIVTIRAVDGSAGIMAVASSISGTTPSKDQLVLTKSGDEMFVSSLSMKDYGMVLNYSIPKEKALYSTASVTKGQATLASAATR